MNLKLVGVALALTAIAAVEKGLATTTMATTPLPLNQLAPAETSLTERSDYINGCRTAAVAIEVYESAQLTTKIGSIPANATVILTGVLGSNVAQIRSPVLGWVQSSNLLNNCGSNPNNGQLPSDIDTNPDYCRRLRDVNRDGPEYSDLNDGLVAFNQPGGTIQSYSGGPDGPSRAAIVRVTRKPPELQDYDFRTWIRVKYQSRSGTPRIGWISNGPIGSFRNVANCLPGQN